MAPFEDKTHVFIVRVWLERRETEDAPIEWRGVIEHIPTRKRRYLKDLDKIVNFIAPYLQEMGIELDTSRDT